MWLTLTLKNFKRHKALTINFTEGLNIIVGDNYTGKTSVLEGVLFALWGYTAVPGGKDVAINDEAAKCESELTFVLDNSTYSVKRSGGNATVKKGGSEVAKSASAVTRYLEELFGISKKRFIETQYGEQKKTEALLTWGVTKLHDLIEEVSGAGIVTEAIESAKKIGTSANAGLEVLVPIDLAMVNSDIARNKTDTLGLKKKAERLASEHKDIIQTLLTNKQELADAVSSNDKRNRLETSAGDLNGEIEDALYIRESYQQTMDEAGNSVSEKEVVTSSLADLEAELTDLEGEVVSAEKRAAVEEKVGKKLDVLMRQLKERPDIIGDITSKEDIAIAKEARSEAMQDVVKANASLTALRKTITDSVCETCGQDIVDVDVEAVNLEIEEVIEANNVLTTKYDDTKATVVKMIETNTALREEEDKVLAISDKIESLTENLEDVTENLISLSQEDIDNKRERVTSIESEINALSKKLRIVTKLAAQFLQAEARLEAVTEKIETLNEKLAVKTEKLVNADDYVDTDKLKAVIVSDKERLTKINTEETETSVNIAKVETELTALTERLNNGKENNAKIKALSVKAGTAKELVAYLRKNRDRFLTSVWNGIMEQASLFTAKSTGGDIEEVIRTQEGKFAFIENGKQKQIEAASGAQRSIMGLGIQEALSRMLPCTINSLLLDEPTADASPHKSLLMVSALSEDNAQIIMVTHREHDGIAADNIIELS